MTQTVPFSCKCGQITGTIPRAAGHIRCYCDSCRAAEIYLDQPDTNGEGITVMRFAPQTVIFKAGQDKLALMQVTPKGAYRWYASCCKTPMFSTATSPKLAYAALKGTAAVNRDDFGKELGFVYKPEPGGKVRHKGMGGMITGVMGAALAALVTGNWRKSPFFDANGAPVAVPELMPKDIRKKILAGFSTRQ